MELVIDILSWIAIMSGSAFMLIGALGTLRFPDFWSRLHAVSIKDSGGMILLTTGMILQALNSGQILIAVKLVIIGIFLFITGPTATHAVANAAMVSGFLPKRQKIPALPKNKTVKAKKTTARKRSVRKALARKSRGKA